MWLGILHSDPPGLKTCRRCLARKPLEDFQVRRASVDGRQDWCRDCLNGWVRIKHRGGTPPRPKTMLLLPEHLLTLEMVARGATHTEIARVLCIHPGHVYAYTRKAKDALGAETVTQAVATAVARGLVRVEAEREVRER